MSHSRKADAATSSPSKAVRRGAKAKDFIFTNEQHKHLDALISEFEAEVERVNPKLKAHNEKLTKWKKETSVATMKLDLFKDNATPDLPLKKWEAAIRRKFTNYYNNTLKPHLLASKPQNNKHPGKASDPEKRDSSFSSKPLNNVLARAMVIFTSEFPARELFASENEDALRAQMDAVHARHPDLVGGALRNKALKKLWKKADQREWEERAAAMAADVDANQKEFPSLMVKAIQNLLERGRLGSIITSLNYAYYGTNGGIVYGTIYNGYNAETEEQIEWKYDDHANRVKGWKDAAETFLPPPPAEQAHSPIPFNDAGLPVFPKFDLMSATGQQVVGAVQDYLDASWKYAMRNRSMIPWADIVKNPGKYYDTDTFKLPIALNHPKTYSRPSDIHALVDYFTESSISASPFCFYPRNSDTSTVASNTLTPNELSPSNSMEITQTEDSVQSSKGLSNTSVAIPTISPLTLSAQTPVADSSPSVMDVSIKVSIQPSDRPASPGPANVASGSPASKALSPIPEIHPNTVSATQTPVANSASATVSSNKHQRTKTGKKGRKKSEKKPATESITVTESGQAESTRRSGRIGQKRKGADSIAPEVQESTRPGKRKKHGWINTDDSGNYWTESGQSCDKDGNLL
ncbi:hypothetical protein BDZ97DRAFT_1756336 [Flammula alnicola]|nr:hypothetical protein BDZ97DRAFT_1756336 [Flammula alnicola]